MRRRGVEHRRRSGPTKRRLAGELLPPAARRASRRAASLHFGQGKWYPGEPLPRWALGCYWRTRRRAGLARPGAARRRARRPTAPRRADARALRRARWRERLGVDRRARASPAYEDAWYYLWRERRLPVERRSVRRRDARRPDGARRGCAACSTQGLERVGRLRAAAAPRRRRTARALAERAVVPARRAAVPDARRFADGLPPAARLAALGGARRTIRRRTSPIRSRRAAAARRLPSRAESLGAAGAPTGASRRPAPRTGRGTPRDVAGCPARGESADGIVRTALCVEPRDGRLHVFMPPRRRARGLPRAGRRGRGRPPRRSACR